MAELKINLDVRRHWHNCCSHDTQDSSGVTQKGTNKILDDIESVKAERDNFERKGKELCLAYGNALMTIYDLKAEIKDLRKQLGQ